MLSLKYHIKISAVTKNWNQVYRFLQKCMKDFNISMPVQKNILIAAEEIFVNISKYAYPKGTGNVLIELEYSSEGGILQIKFVDKGIPFNPTVLPEPNVKDSIENRKIGGLGIFMVKKMMDQMKYIYKNGNNNLLIIKKIN